MFVRNSPVGNSVRSGLIPVAGRHAAAADQYFAVLGQLHFAAGEHLPDRAFAQAEGMIHTDQRCSLGEAVALDSGVTEAIPELFGVAVERRTSRNECPKLPPETAANGAENPPAAQEVLALGSAKAFLEIV